MKYDNFGQAFCDVTELSDLLYQDPKLDISRFLTTNPEQYNSSVMKLFADFPLLQQYSLPLDSLMDDSIQKFDQNQQNRWFMPDEYRTMDIAKWVLDQCSTQEQLQRVGHELFLFQDRDMFNLLRYLKYFVDTMRAHNIVWGVGRGSSVASYVLYKIGIHRIDSLLYDLPIEEFLK
jgi:DNA polymerase III alpha subunit